MTNICSSPTKSKIAFVLLTTKDKPLLLLLNKTCLASDHSTRQWTWTISDYNILSLIFKSFRFKSVFNEQFTHGLNCFCACAIDFSFKRKLKMEREKVNPKNAVKAIGNSFCIKLFKSIYVQQISPLSSYKDLVCQ